MRPHAPAAKISLIFLIVISILPRGTLADEGADEPDDGESAEPAATASQPERLGALLASTEDLYDFTALAELDPRYQALLEAYRHRQYGAVVRQAAEVATTARQSQVAQAALHLLALSHEAQRHWPEAERAWQRLAQAGPFAQRARGHLADLALKRKDVDEALVQLAAVAPWHVTRDAATLQMAKLELDRGQVGPTRDALERIRPPLLSRNQRSQMAFLKGEVARRGSNPQEAIAQYLLAWNMDEEPHASQAALQLRAMDAEPSPSDQIERILRRRGVKADQLRMWLREAEAITDTDGALRAYVRGALLAREKATRGQAIEQLREAVESLTDPVLRGRALYALGDALGKAGQDREAIEKLTTIQEMAAGAETQARALQRLHRLYNAVNQPKEAEQVLVKLLDQHPHAEERELALWGLAWQRFLSGDHAGALKHLVKLEREYGQLWTGALQPWRAKAIYWQGRCLAQMGQLDAAMEAWASVTNTYAQTYYGVLSLDRIREIEPERADRLQGPPPSPADTHQPPLSLDRVRVAKNAALDEAVLLVRMGLTSESQLLLARQVGHGLPRDGIHLLATLYELDGRRRAAYGVMQRHTRRAARPDDATAGVWRQSFPSAFYPEASDASQAAGISRTLLYAIMRHESAFLPTATSKVGALGLTQLMPPSARAVAELHKIGYPGAGSLYRPAYNLQIGSLYLAQLLSLFRNNQAAAAAAYNAGPYAVQPWVKKLAGQQTDVFVESIPYPATRAYVMQVTASAQTYAWLYPEWGEIQRDQLARTPNLPTTLGPFMQKQPSARQTAASN